MKRSIYALIAVWAALLLAFFWISIYATDVATGTAEIHSVKSTYLMGFPTHGEPK